MRLAITSNGPGEFSGWVRPLLGTLLQRAPGSEVTLFFVPDDFATGAEPEVARRLFPSVRVVPPKDYLRFALGAPAPGAPQAADLVLYLGGDLMHAARVRARLGAHGRAYKFSRKRYAKAFERVYAVDAANRAELERHGVASERILVVGNLAVDGAFGEAAGRYASEAGDDARVPGGGILILPGARKHEVETLVPFFLQAAVRMRALAPEMPVAFALSPFTGEAALAAALAGGGHPRVWGARGTLVHDGGLALRAESGEVFPVVRDAMRYANHARLAVTIPGTKCIELAALGVPALVCVPLNAPELAVINGPLQYLDRVPAIGLALKRSIAIAYERRFRFTAQPNIDAGEMLMPELRGTLTPGTVARRALAYAGDRAELARVAPRLRALYAAHAGASERLAADLLAAA